jgi:hypothetical protein
VSHVETRYHRVNSYLVKPNQVCAGNICVVTEQSAAHMRAGLCQASCSYCCRCRGGHRRLRACTCIQASHNHWLCAHLQASTKHCRCCCHRCCCCCSCMLSALVVACIGQCQPRQEGPPRKGDHHDCQVHPAGWTAVRPSIKEPLGSHTSAGSHQKHRCCNGKSALVVANVCQCQPRQERPPKEEPYHDRQVHPRITSSKAKV